MDRIVKIDGKEYSLESLDDETKAHLASIQAVDRRILDLKEQIAIHQTARIGYANVLKNLIEKEVPVEIN